MDSFHRESVIQDLVNAEFSPSILMLIHRHSTVLGYTAQDLDMNFALIRLGLAKLEGYKLRMNGEEQMVKDTLRMEMILRCKHSGMTSAEDECPQDFHHVPTSLGICSTFNAAKLADVHVPKKSDYWTSLTQLYNVKKRGEVFYGAMGNLNLHDISLMLDLKSR